MVGINRLYDHGALMMHSTLLHQRLAPNAVWMHPTWLPALACRKGRSLLWMWMVACLERVVHLDDGMPQAVALASPLG